MSYLPEDRLHPGPPFTFIGIDTFGPWPIIHRKTRGGCAQQKRWAILFTCLVSRAIHIEVTEKLSSSSFINAFRRFIALRGNVKLVRSDRGTNFIGAIQDLASVLNFLKMAQSTRLFLGMEQFGSLTLLMLHTLVDHGKE